MIQIIPSVLEQSKKSAHEKIQLIQKFSPVIQMDVCDGIFSDARTLQSSDFSRSDFGKLMIEAHLMVQDPESFVDQWIALGAKKIILHAEAKPRAQLIQHIASHGVEPAIACKATSTVKDIEPYSHLVHSFLFLSIDPPGHQGFPLHMPTLVQMKRFHDAHPEYTLEADGGVNDTTLQKFLAAGATQLVVGSWLFAKDTTPEKQYRSLVVLAQEQGKTPKNMVQ